MTPTTHQAPDKSPLTDDGRKLVLTAANIVYDPQGVDMIKQALANTKTAKAITPTVAMLTTTLLHKMGDAVDSIPEEEMWGKHGVVHTILDSVFEVAKQLGYKAPHSELKQAYEMVETQLQESKGNPQAGEDQQGGPQAAPDVPPMQGAMPDQGPPPGAAQAPPPNMPMQGAMQ